MPSLTETASWKKEVAWKNREKIGSQDTVKRAHPLRWEVKVIDWDNKLVVLRVNKTERKINF